MIKERFLTFEELAEMLKLPANTLKKWRYLGEGPKGTRFGRHVRFDVKDVEQWLEDRRSQKVS